MSKSDWLIDAPKPLNGKKSDKDLCGFIVKLMRGENLALKESSSFFRALVARNANPEQLAGSLVALLGKGETFEELAGMAKVMNQHAKRVSTRHKKYIDLAGTGSSHSKTFNVSTAASFVVAGAGLTTAKHSRRAVASKSGSADVLSQLKVKISGEPKLAQACLSGTGLCFMFAPKFHPKMLRLADIERNLGVPTSLHLLYPLSNPSNAPFQVLGVWHPSLVEPMAQALALLGRERAWVVHGSDGLDELTLNGNTYVSEVSGNKIRTFQISPQDFGMTNADISGLKVKTAKQSAEIIHDVLSSNRRDEARSLVIINAAAALLVGGVSDDPMQAARLAEQSIDSGSARMKLDRLIQTTNKR